MKQQMQPISIVIPTLNEADNLNPLFERIYASLADSGIDHEIIVVDDHSTDKTAEIAKNANPKYNVRLLMKQGTPGKAESLMEGFAAAENELVCMIDGDLQYPPEAIKMMYHKMQYCEADIVLTERVDNNTSAIRKAGSYMINLIFARMLFGINYDTQSGLKLFRKSILKTISIDPSPWTFDLEFIVRALEQDYKIVSQQIKFSERNAGVPKIHLLSATKEVAVGSVKLWRNSSAKRVRTSYRRSEVLQRSLNLLVALFTVSVFASVAAPATSSALSASRPVIASDSFYTSVKRFFSGYSQDNSPKPAATTTAEQPQQTAPTPVPAASPSTAPTVVTPPAKAPIRTATASTTESSVAAAPATTATPPVSSSETTKSTTRNDSSTLKSAQYYPASQLSSSKTQQLHSVALLAAIVGAVFIVLGLITLAIKRLTIRMRDQVYTT